MTIGLFEEKLKEQNRRAERIEARIWYFVIFMYFVLVGGILMCYSYTFSIRECGCIGEHCADNIFARGRNIENINMSPNCTTAVRFTKTNMTRSFPTAYTSTGWAESYIKDSIWISKFEVNCHGNIY